MAAVCWPSALSPRAPSWCALRASISSCWTSRLGEDEVGDGAAHLVPAQGGAEHRVAELPRVEPAVPDRAPHDGRPPVDGAGDGDPVAVPADGCQRRDVGDDETGGELQGDQLAQGVLVGEGQLAERLGPLGQHDRAGLVVGILQLARELLARGRRGAHGLLHGGPAALSQPLAQEDQAEVGHVAQPAPAEHQVDLADELVGRRLQEVAVLPRVEDRQRDEVGLALEQAPSDGALVGRELGVVDRQQPAGRALAAQPVTPDVDQLAQQEGLEVDLAPSEAARDEAALGGVEVDRAHVRAERVPGLGELEGVRGHLLPQGPFQDVEGLEDLEGDLAADDVQELLVRLLGLLLPHELDALEVDLEAERGELGGEPRGGLLELERLRGDCRLLRLGLALLGRLDGGRHGEGGEEDGNEVLDHDGAPRSLRGEVGGGGGRWGPGILPPCGGRTRGIVTYGPGAASFAASRALWPRCTPPRIPRR